MRGFRYGVNGETEKELLPELIRSPRLQEKIRRRISKGSETPSQYRAHVARDRLHPYPEFRDAQTLV